LLVTHDDAEGLVVISKVQSKWLAICWRLSLDGCQSNLWRPQGCLGQEASFDIHVGHW
jgi:hypothetical protein